MNDRIGDWIETYTGGSFWPLDPYPSEVNIRDIAHSLSLKCRFGGHCQKFYSVAQHSVYVAESFAKMNKDYEDWAESQMYALLHDAGEGYLCDIPRPVKLHLPQFKELENKIMDVVYEHFGLDIEQLQNVSNHMNRDLKKDLKIADSVLLATEARDLMRNYEEWNFPFIPLEKTIIPLNPPEAERLFLEKYDELRSKM